MAELELTPMAVAENARQRQLSGRLYCCSSTGCLSSGAGAVMEAIAEALASRNLSDEIEVVPTGCMGICSEGPLLRVELEGAEPCLYHTMNPLLARLIVADHLAPALQTTRVGEFELPPFLADRTLDLGNPFFARQEKVVLANCGTINPESLEHYVARGGYEGLTRALAMTPGEVIDVLLDSGLRGRGGGGYPTGKKWRFVREASGDEKFVVCNADEGDPGAYMDRSILEGDPHAVLEGMLIAAHATGAREGWFYIRAEYPLAVERIEKAIRTARRAGLLGKNILGRGLDFSCQVRLGAGAFVCGEETALIASLEGRRGTPQARPPYPSTHGLWDCPSCVNNVETLANVGPILRHGAGWFASRGTESSRGTKVFALTGKVARSGLIEVPMGTSLRTIVEEIGGGAPGGRGIKAVQTGGPSGGVIPERLLDVGVCYEELSQLGSMMGSGGMIVMDEGDSMLDAAEFYLGFAVEESCGKCAPCRIGAPQMRGLLQKIQRGEATFDDLDKLRPLALTMRRASLCGLGQTAPNPVLSTLNYFEDDYTDKLRVFASRDEESKG